MCPVPEHQVGDSKPGFYAIASPPDPNNAGLVELLIKSVPGTTAEILAGSSAGANHHRRIDCIKTRRSEPYLFCSL